MLAAPDGHAKNFSLQLLAGGAYRLAPLYDAMSIWPVEGPDQGQWSWHKAKMCMALPGKKRHHPMKHCQRRHFNGLGVLCGLGTDVEPLFVHIIERTESVIQEVSARVP
ncbi:MAG: hipA [Polaromonas sp.]|nr:hipA [Polaromonas sp.]